MTLGMNKMVNGMFGIGAVVIAVAAMPTTARADRWDRDHARRGGWINVDVRAGGNLCQPPVVVDQTQQVWVEPVYRTVVDRIWVAPAYQITCDKVWVEPVIQKQVQRVWVLERRELREVHHGFGRVTREWVVTPAHYEDVTHDVIVTPGHYEDVNRQVLVAEGHWQDVPRQELVIAGHWETRVNRVAVAPPPARDGLRIDLHFPIR